MDSRILKVKECSGYEHIDLLMTLEVSSGKWERYRLSRWAQVNHLSIHQAFLASFCKSSPPDFKVETMGYNS